LVGAHNVQEFEPTMGAEDFSFYLLEKPGCYFMIGNGEGSHRMGGHGAGPCMLHNPSYDFNDELIPLGGTMWVRLAETWLNAPGAADRGVLRAGN
jgi:hippurate hydrolase